MLLAADDLAGRAAASTDRSGGPAGTGHAEVGREEADQGNDDFATIGALAGAIVDKLRNSDRAARIAPRVGARAPAAGSVATKGRRRPTIQEKPGMPDIGTTHVIATILAGLARERQDRGESLLQFIEAESGYLHEKMPTTAEAMRIACRDARRMRGREHVAAG